jgi:signal transduction histidine kinase
LYRIIQEALNNIAKHARASYVSVLFEKRGDNFILIAEDNGDGFAAADIDTPDQPGGGLGLVGMRERAALIGADIEIESAPGQGTTIYVRIKVQDQ